jgi:fluoride exporter
MNWVLVFIGGGFGSLVRYGISVSLKNYAWAFPFSTLISNVLASFIIGILTGIALKGALSNEQKILFATGFCGGFSTFSTFSNETLQLFQQGQVFLAAINIAASIVFCLLATFWGLRFFI